MEGANLLDLNINKKKFQEKQRNKEIDIIKGIACICVVYIHCPFPGHLGNLISVINRFSVPFFFFISGFYFLFITSFFYF